jgi:hypothetical protein
MGRLLSIFVLILISGVCFGQDLSKTQTAKQVTTKQDTIKRKVVSQQSYRFQIDSVYIKEQEKKIKYLDSINNARKSKKIIK